MPHPFPGEPRARPHPASAPQSRAASAALLHLARKTFAEFPRATRVKIVNLLKFVKFGLLAFLPPRRGGLGWGRGAAWLRVFAGVEPPPQPLPGG